MRKFKVIVLGGILGACMGALIGIVLMLILRDESAISVISATVSGAISSVIIFTTED